MEHVGLHKLQVAVEGHPGVEKICKSFCFESISKYAMQSKTLQHPSYLKIKGDYAKS